MRLSGGISGCFAIQFKETRAKCSEAWDLIAESIRAEWLDPDELHELIKMLEAGCDFGVQDCLFEILEDDVRVHFLSDFVECKLSDLLADLKAFLATIETQG